MKIITVDPKTPWWIGYKLIGGAVVGVALLQLGITNYLSSSGAELSNVLQKVSALSTQNSLLENKIGSQLSLSAIGTQAVEIGLVRPKKIVFSSSPAPVALRPQL